MCTEFYLGMYLGGLFLGLFYFALEWDPKGDNKTFSRIMMNLFWPIVLVLAFIGRSIHKNIME